MSEDMKYFRGTGTVPKKVPEGRSLAHNNIQHTKSMGNGLFGFRCWTWPKGKVPRNFKRCNCGWSGLPHYSATPNYKCMTEKAWTDRLKRIVREAMARDKKAA